MEYLLHGRPPLSLLPGGKRLLARLAELPPLLRALIGGHSGHVGGKVTAAVLEVAEEEPILVVDGVVTDVALPDPVQDRGPDGGVQPLVLLQLLRPYPENHSVSLQFGKSLLYNIVLYQIIY